ncbi:bifunctional DNA-binding transcriptional regulator/O6-methylguanine-DNA methyltransferase Ada [bacterium]|nr:bifunctional DNA-binding transcriptional regulator/O6-methylguanine-DNA methyltransferase Ada [bacterium]
MHNDPRWQAVVNRQDEPFFYSVETTKVYCRPGCGSRLPRPENVNFYDSAHQAEQAGFRACKRCQPDQPSLAERQAALMVAACRRIEASDELPDSGELARQAGLSRSHFQRLFHAVIGMTPKAYAAAHRWHRVREHLTRGATVTQAIYESGYNSGGRFYESSERTLGMTPGQFRDGGANAVLRFAVGQCSLGAILVACSERGVCSILLGDDAQRLTEDLQDRFPRAQLIGADGGFEAMVAQVVGFVEAPALGLQLPLDMRGTVFQKRVWQALCSIPAGTTVSYTQLAQKIGLPKAVRAVASACAANPLAVAIPCHRVVRSDGGLSGYRWGVERKRDLLEREAQLSGTGLQG